MKVLLADDQASEGWEDILSKILPVNENDISVEETVKSAIDRVENEVFDLIFLDLRFGEKDHNESDVEKLGGFKILEAAKSNFNSKNFPTPITLFTATNKIWNVDFMVQNGVDDYYIKEHPDQAGDLEYSRKNYQRLKASIPNLISLNNNRKRIWNKIQKISNGKYVTNSNIRKRIDQKLKIGYGIIFMNNSELNKRELLYNSEVLAFVVYWSILEELSKFCFKDHWDRELGGMKDGKPWILKNNEPFIEPIIQDGTSKLKVSLKWNASKKYYSVDLQEVTANDRYFGLPALREQIWAVLLLEKGWSSDEVKSRFEPLRLYRNKIDFIHSSTSAIFNEQLTQKAEDKESDYLKVIKMLDLLEKMVSE